MTNDKMMEMLNKRVEARTENYEMWREDYESDLKHFKKWVAEASDKELMNQLLGKYESLVYSYRTMKESEDAMKEVAYMTRLLSRMEERTSK